MSDANRRILSENAATWQERERAVGCRRRGGLAAQQEGSHGGCPYDITPSAGAVRTAWRRSVLGQGVLALALRRRVQRLQAPEASAEDHVPQWRGHPVVAVRI